MRETIISIGGMEAGHSEQVLKNMVGQIAAAKFLVPPLFQWDINIGDGSTERGGIFSRHGMHVLGPWAGHLRRAVPTSSTLARRANAAAAGQSPSYLSGSFATQSSVRC